MAANNNSEGALTQKIERNFRGLMQPFVIILGIVLGSLVSIAFGLSAVLLVFWILQDEHPRFSAEMPALIQSAAIFTVLAAVAVAGFVGTLRARFWRYPVLGLLWLGLLATVWFFWPP
jgi:hypothetical protein